jgi:hypothetical protein
MALLKTRRSDYYAVQEYWSGLLLPVCCSEILFTYFFLLEGSTLVSLRDAGQEFVAKDRQSQPS